MALINQRFFILSHYALVLLLSNYVTVDSYVTHPKIILKRYQQVWGRYDIQVKSSKFFDTAHVGSVTSTSIKMQKKTEKEYEDNVDMSDVGFVVLAGGTGSRMKANMPKQFMTLRGKTVLQHSLDLFLDALPKYLKDRGERGPRFVVLVMDPKFRDDFSHLLSKYDGSNEGGNYLVFADPGEERQGSVENGLKTLIQISQGGASYVAVHDSARPLVTIREVINAVQDAKEYGAAVLGVPCKATIKESLDGGQLVSRTLQRKTLYEVHTPQVMKIEALRRGFDLVRQEDLEVTDDVSIIEALGEPVKITMGEYTNLKITTPEDMDVANAILEERESITAT